LIAKKSYFDRPAMARAALESPAGQGSIKTSRDEIADRGERPMRLKIACAFIGLI
jgi:hypothetical protein